jgi:hypothetical protein
VAEAEEGLGLLALRERRTEIEQEG